LDQHRLPVHIPTVTRWMLEAMSAALPEPLHTAFRLLLDPERTDNILDTLGPEGSLLDALLHNTVNATIVHGGEKVNVIPSEITLELDGRLLPGFDPADMTAELRQLTGDDLEFEIVRYDPGPPEPDMGLFATLASILRAADPAGVPVPLLESGFTDARLFAQLGIQTYGFLPMNLPPDFSALATIHAANERIPADAVAFGANAIYEVLRRFGEHHAG